MNYDLIIAVSVLVVVLIIYLVWKKPLSSGTSGTSTFGHNQYTVQHAHKGHKVHMQKYPPFVHHGIHYDYKPPADFSTQNIHEIRAALETSNWRYYFCPQAPLDIKTKSQLGVLFPGQTISNHHQLINHYEFLIKNCQGGPVWIHPTLPARKYVQNLADLQAMSTQ